MNFDNRSMALNDESTLMVLDRGTGAQMVRLFLEDLRHATEVTAAELQRQSWRGRVAQRTANLLTRLL
jgi:phosphatidylserine/phosphatidylglycerophosphate/cardiolipin synthase-like enzyme